MPEDASSGTCIRCRDRSAQCEFATQPKEEPRGGDVTNATRSAGESTTLALAKRSGQSTNMETTALPQGSPNSSGSLEWLVRGTCDNGFGGFHFPLSEIPLYVELGIQPLLIPRGEQPDVVDSGISALAPWDLSGPSLFEPRTFSNPSQGPLALLALQILRSYPFMMLQKAALPPFINPMQASWVETGVGPRQQVS